MKLTKFFIYLTCITFISLFYVHLSFLIIESNYNIKGYEREISLLLDRSRELMYNVTALESPDCLLAKLDACGLKYEIPRSWTVSNRIKSDASYEVVNIVKRRNAVFEKIVSIITRDAVAKSLNN
ncbi:MAG: hypothetical protein JW800_06010 [Candidatus Omnitrophica bacterium]|nr:hypothetical protein [Candidatus Omnitrophota bacterium]